MANEVTTLALGVDSSQVPVATQRLDALTASGNKAAGAATTLANGLQKAGSSGASNEFNKLAVSARNGADSLEKAAVATGHAAHGSSGLVRELLVMTHETAVGNFTRLGGSLLVLAKFSQAGLAAFSALLGPIGAVAAATAAAAVIFAKGAKEQETLRRSLILTGGAAGITTGQFATLRDSIAETTHSGVRNVNEILQALVSSGRFSGDTLKSAATAAAAFTHATHESADDTVKSFVELSHGVFEGAKKLNDTYHLLTPAQLELVRNTERLGDRQGALKIVFDAINQRASEATRNVGNLARAWEDATNWFSKYLQKALDWGKDATTEQQVQALQERLSMQQAQLAHLNPLSPRAPEIQAGINETQRLLSLMREHQALGEASVKIKAVANSRDEAANRIAERNIQNLGAQAKFEREREQINADFQQAGKVGPKDDVERLKQIADARNRLLPRLGQDTLQLNLAKLKSNAEEEVDVIANQEKRLEELHAHGLVSDEEYFDKRRQLIDDDRDKIVASLRSSNELLAHAGKNDEERARNQKQIADNNASIFKKEQDASAKKTTLYFAERDALLAVSHAYIEARQAQDQFLIELNRTQGRDLDNQGLSDKERERRAQVDKINDHADEARRAITNKREVLGTDITAKQADEFERQLVLIEEFRDKALQAWSGYYDERLKKEQDFSTGANRAIANYVDNAKDVAKQSEDVFNKAFSGMEDAIVTFATTGKLDFRSFANSIIADLIRIQVRAQLAKIFDNGGLGNNLAGLIGTAISRFSGSFNENFSNEGRNPGPDSITGGGPRAAGGSVQRGVIYPVNERGTELFNVAGKQYLLPGANGSITPSSGWGSGTYSPTIHVAIDGRSDQAQVQQLVAAGVRQGNEAVFKSLHAMGRL